MSSDPEIRARTKSVFARLSLLSEAPSATLASSGGKVKASSSPPKGTRLSSIRSDRPPPRDRSLHDFYLWHLLRARSDLQRIRVLNEAEAAYYRVVQKTRKAELPPDNEAAMQQVVEDYEGLAPSEVSKLLGYDDDSLVPWITKARRVLGRKVSDGTLRRPWEKWTLSERRDEVGRLRGSGLNNRQIADELEVSVRTIRRY